jgi:hypothetical protein
MAYVDMIDRKGNVRFRDDRSNVGSVTPAEFAKLLRDDSCQERLIYMSQEIKMGESDGLRLVPLRSVVPGRRGGARRSMLPVVRRRTLKVCLVGSSRFMETHVEVLRTLTLCGCIVLPMGLYGHREGLDMSGPVKKMLDMLHLDKIDVADAVFVVNPPTALARKDTLGQSTVERDQVRTRESEARDVLWRRRTRGLHVRPSA